MSKKPVLVPGPDHPITITPATSTVSVSVGGQLVAKTDDALVLLESDYRPVFYIPLDDVDQALLERSTHATYCPYKGDASYYSIRVGGAAAANAVWTYLEPYDAVSAIAGRVAFYPHLVDIVAG